MIRNDSYVLPSNDPESERLGRQARLYGGIDPFEPLLRSQPYTLLDVGCGTGHFTRLLADWFPGASITGLELDDGRLAVARRSHPLVNLRFEQGDLHAMPFEAGQFDLVLCRFVLVHDSDPGAGLAEMVRVTRPGGRVAAYDMVHEGIWFSPPKPAFARVLQATVATMRARGAEPNQGLYLATGMIRAGLTEVSAQVIPVQVLGSDPLYGAYRDNWIETVSSLSDSIGAEFEDGLVDAAKAELERRTGDELLVEIALMASGRKPADCPA